MTEDWLRLGQFSVGCQGATTVLTSSRIKLNLSSITIIMTLFTKMMCTFFFLRCPIHKRILVSLSHLHYYFQNRHGFHIQSCSNRNCPCDGKLYTMFAYTSLSLPINIRKKNCTFISMGNATQKSCKKNKQNNFRHYEVIKICKSMLFWPRVRCRSEETTNMVYNTAERERERRLFFYTCIPTRVSKA